MTDRFIKLGSEKWKNPTPRNLAETISWTLSAVGNFTAEVHGVRLVILKVVIRGSVRYKLSWLDDRRTWRSDDDCIFETVEEAKIHVARALRAARGETTQTPLGDDDAPAPPLVDDDALPVTLPIRKVVLE